MQEEPKLWIVISRPDRLPNALVGADALRDRFPGGVHLLREESKWWKNAKWQEFVSEFAEVHAFPKVRTCRGLKDLPRLYRENVDRQRGVGALPIDPDNDVLLCLAGLLGLGNAALSAHPDVYKILCASQKAYGELTRHGDRTRFRFTTSGWLQNRVVEPLAGVERTIHYKPRINPGGDGVRLRRLQRDPDEIFDVIIFMSNSGGKLPTRAEDQIIPSRFPSIAELRNFYAQLNARQDRQRRVIFFGTPFLLVKNLAPEVYVEHLNRCLDYIRQNYPGRELIYRPHPFEKGEASRLNLEGFQAEDDREVADLYFLRHFAEIEAIYSVSSTVSRTALNNGLNSYALWRCFPFSETQTKFFRKVMGDVPPEFEISDLTKSPVAYQDRQSPVGDATSFTQALNRALDLRETILA
ncbi:MAG TPA: hypothetical protein VN827_08535 [Chthoniobacterales bacterium]|jgi:hypothetical protein|nr:hypothetical protein [Chthoniobacterales bacterium]